MRAVNLLPDDRRGSAGASPLAGVRRQPLLLLAIVASLAIAGGLVLEVRSATSTVTSRQQTLRALDAQLAALPKPSQVDTSAAATQASRMNVVTTVAGRRTTWDGFLYAVSRVLPEDVWLLNLSANATSGGTSATPTGTAPAVSAPGSFTITGYTYSQPSVARLMRRLRLVPWLHDVNLSTSSKTSLANKVVYQFTVGANVVPLPEVKS